MKQRLITRHDTEVGEGEFDSIAWAFSEHIKGGDPQILKSGILYGNEDAPSKIEFYSESDPTTKSKVFATWTPEEGFKFAPLKTPLKRALKPRRNAP